jgi:hypothetical protein
MIRDTPWVKATASGGNGGSCFLVRGNDGMIEVRDSKTGPDGPVQRYREDEWLAFLEGIRNGEFDILAG